MGTTNETDFAEVAAPTNGRGRKAAKTEVPLPFEAKLWAAADKARGQMEEGDYKHIVLGLVFLKFVSDAFERRRAELVRLFADPSSDYFIREASRQAALEARDGYTAGRVPWVPAEARWSQLARQAKSGDIGVRIDTAMDLIERENHSLKGVLPKVFARPEVPSRLLGELIDLFSSVDVHPEEGSSEDVLGRVYEYFLNRFGTNEGGQYYTPQQIVRLLVEMLEPFKGRVYDPCCGSGGMFVQSLRFVEEHGGRHGDIRVVGQEAVPATWRLAKMNLAIRHIEGDLAERWGDSFHDDLHPDLRADFVLANPPFNDSDWGGDRLREDKRWEFGTPPESNANFAWVQHFLHHLSSGGSAGFVLANGSLTGMQNGEDLIRQRLVEADLVDCIVALPKQLFFRTQIAVSLWFINKNRHGNRDLRDRTRETLFIDARGMGHMVTRAVRALSDEDVSTIADTYRRWRRLAPAAPYEDVSGFCYAASMPEIAAKGYVLNPGDYIAAPPLAGQTSDEVDAMRDLVPDLSDAFARTRGIEARLIGNLGAVALATEPWPERRLVDIADIQFGFPFASRLFNTTGEGMPLIRIRDLADGICSVHTTQPSAPEYVVEPGDLVVGMDGEFRPYLWRSPRALLNQRVCKITPKEGPSYSALLQAALAVPLAQLERAKMGTTVIHLNKRDLDPVTLPWPDPDRAATIADLLWALAERREQPLEADLLERLRTLLWRGVATGSIQVGE